MNPILKVRTFMKTIKNGLFGIAAEILVVALVVVVSFFVCMIWWRIF